MNNHPGPTQPSEKPSDLTDGKLMTLEGIGLGHPYDEVPWWVQWGVGAVCQPSEKVDLLWAVFLTSCYSQATATREVGVFCCMPEEEKRPDKSSIWGFLWLSFCPLSPFF